MLLVNSTFGGVSGSGQYVKELYYRLLKRGYNVYMIFVKNVGYVNIPKLKSLSFFALAKLRSCFNALPECDIIHIHNPKFAGLIGNKPSIITIHGDYKTELKAEYGNFAKGIIWLIDKWIRRGDIVTTVSSYWANVRGWKYIPNGVDLRYVKKIKPSNESCVLFVGRKDPVKGYDLFIDVMNGLNYPHMMLGMQGEVPRDTVIGYMKSAMCLVIPSKVEGFPTVLLEAWASGCPVVASPLPTLKAISEDAIYFAEERSVQAFRKAVKKVIEDGELRERLIRHGFEEVRKYDWENIVNEYERLYRRLAEYEARCQGELT